MAKNTRKPNRTPSLPGSKVAFSFRRHILPPTVGLLITVLLLGFFNSQLIAGRVAHARTKNLQSNAQSVAPADPVAKDAPPQLKINKLGIEAPVIFDVKTVNEDQFQLALREGVVHYPGTALPGSAGNTVIFGHSSNQLWAPGNYKYVFALLDKLERDDKLVVEYQGTRYIYSVTNKLVVQPDDISVLKQGQDKQLTLITCTPVGTNTNRLIIQAKQIVPAASQTTLEQTTPAVPKAQTLPAESRSLWASVRAIFN